MAVVDHSTQGQHAFSWCGPAATRVALTCRGLVVDQAVLARELGTDDGGTDSSNDVVRVLNAHLGAGQYGARFIAGRDATSDQRVQLRVDLQAAIKAGYGLVANVVGTILTVEGAAYGYKNGHYVAVVGERNDGSEALVADVAVGRDYWVTTSRLATWIAERGYSYPLVTAPAAGDGGMPPVPVGAEGVDYSFSRPNARGLAAAGIRFAGRYVGPGSGKHLDAAELQALLSAGVAVFLLAEGTADGAKGGYAVGQAHARAARTHARALGFPDSVPVYYAVDYDVSEANWAAPRDYLRGACDVDGLARVGVYGDVQALEWSQRDGVASWFFQTLSASAWSQGRVFPGNHVEQYRNGVTMAGGEVDLCHSRRADFGQWPTGQGSTDEGDDEDMAKIQGTLCETTDDAGGNSQVRAWHHEAHGPVYLNLISDKLVPVWKAQGFEGPPEGGYYLVPHLSDLGRDFYQAQREDAALFNIYDPEGQGGGTGGGGPVDVSARSVEAIADRTADTLADDPERDGSGK